MKNKNILIILAFLSLNAISRASVADQNPKMDPEKKSIHLCEGIWTTNPCHSPEKELPYKKFDKNNFERIQLEKKENYENTMNKVLDNSEVNLKRGPELIRRNFSVSHIRPTRCTDPHILESVSFNIKNTGDEMALGIEVEVRTPGGNRIKANGAGRLRPNQSSDFNVKINEIVLSALSNPTIMITCKNCTSMRRFGHEF
jgi:hypothetical protein